MERILDLPQADVLVRGHTHLPFHRILPRGRRVVNAGRRKGSILLTQVDPQALIFLGGWRTEQ
jgi:hypothetical protein